MPNSLLVADPDICLVMTTLPSADEAATIARHVVSTGLAACTQCSTTPVSSTYIWKGALETTHEVTMTAKTTRAAAPLLCNEIARLHPYDVPEIVVLDVTLAADSYTRWVHETVHLT